MKRVPFLTVCNIQGGTQPPKSEWISSGENGYVRMLQIRDFTQPDRSKREFVRDKPSLKKCNENDILIARYGASVGKILTGLSGAYNVAMAKCVLDEKALLDTYLKYWLRGIEFQVFIKNVGDRAAQAGFNKDDFKDLLIPLPSLEEQKRIAAILDKAEAIRRKREEAIKLADEFLRSVFLDMFGGHLTGGKDSSKCKLGDQIKLQRGMDITKRSAIHGSVPVISSGGISFYHNVPIMKGPGVLLGRKGSVGKVHYTPTDYWPHDTTLFVKDFKGNEPLFVYYFFKKFPISDYEESAANPSLNRNNLHPVEVFWPRVESQRRFGAIVESVERQKSKLKEQLGSQDKLFASLQQRAFKGEL